MDTIKIIIDVIMLAVCAVIIFLAVKRGFVKSIFKSSKVILSVLITFFLKGVASSLFAKWFVNDWFEGKISQKFMDMVSQGGEGADFNSLFSSLPQIAQNFLPREELEASFASFSGTVTEKAFEFGASIEQSLISLVSTVIGCVALFIVAFIALSIVAFILDKVVQLPVLKQVNVVLGVLWGVASSYILMSVLVCIIMLFADASFINETKVLQFFYNYGLFTGFN